MKNAADTLPRRTFLSGAASLFGATAVGAVPRLGGQVAGPHAGALVAYFWNGLKFVPIAQATSRTQQTQVQVRIKELAGSAAPVAIDAIMPGGAFHAYVGTPQGSGQASFSSPYASAGIELAVSQGSSSKGSPSQTFQLGANGAVGFYLLVPFQKEVGTLALIQGSVITVIDTSGAPLSNPTILVELL